MMPGIIGLGLVTWAALGLVLAAEPPEPLAVWDQCRDEALAEHHRQTQALIARCFARDTFVCTEDEVRALPEADALILDRCGPEPLTATGALQARSCDVLYRFACLTPDRAFLSAQVAILDPRAFGETQAQGLAALRAGDCGELTREVFGRLICHEPQATTPVPSLPNSTPGPRVLTSARLAIGAG
jgi:hypothetical protein